MNAKQRAEELEALGREQRVTVRYDKGVDATFVQHVNPKPRQKRLAAQFAGRRVEHAREWAQKHGYTVEKAPRYPVTRRDGTVVYVSIPENEKKGGL